jgi:inorganic pyrophosphatase
MAKRRASVPPAASDLDPIDRKSGQVNVVIEAGRGTRNKYKYDQETRLFALHRVLPSGTAFPLDFGFVPGTEGEDGDPLDILLFSDDPLAVGSVVPSRLLGVLEAEQTEGGKTKRNDRLVAVTAEGQEFLNLHSLKDLPEKKVKAFESFFVNYNAQRKVQFRILGARGPARAKELIEQGRRTYRRKSGGR